ncbi:hypothetical protein KM043_014424 [Ampulex compressa]|nr:hypothetical protein KM043_014424 [Ampulex compressa]
MSGGTALLIDLTTKALTRAAVSAIPMGPLVKQPIALTLRRVRFTTFLRRFCTVLQKELPYGNVTLDVQENVTSREPLSRPGLLLLMSELLGTRELFHSAIIPYNPQDLLGRGRQAGRAAGIGGGGVRSLPVKEAPGEGGKAPAWWGVHRAVGRGREGEGPLSAVTATSFSLSNSDSNRSYAALPPESNQVREDFVKRMTEVGERKKEGNEDQSCSLLFDRRKILSQNFENMELGHTIEDTKKKYPEITDEILEELQKRAQENNLSAIPKEQLAIFAHSCYFNVEAAARCMEVYYRMRSTIPEFFANRDPNLENLQRCLQMQIVAASPVLDRNGCQLVFYKLMDTEPRHYVLNDAIKMILMLIEAVLYTQGCCAGYIFVMDMQGVKFGHLTRITISTIQKFFEYIQEGLPIRMKSIHIVNAVWFTGKLLTIFKPFMKKEFYQLLHCHTGDISELHAYIEQDFLPQDYGGKLDSFKDMRESTYQKLKQLRDYFMEEEALFRTYSTASGELSKNTSPEKESKEST